MKDTLSNHSANVTVEHQNNNRQNELQNLGNVSSVDKGQNASIASVDSDVQETHTDIVDMENNLCNDAKLIEYFIKCNHNIFETNLFKDHDNPNLKDIALIINTIMIILMITGGC